MQPQPANAAVSEAGKVLDTLAVLSLELSCHCDVPPQTLVLEAGKLREACAAIDEAVSSLKRILAIADDGSLIPAPPPRDDSTGG